jgi:hypothetical protein
LPEAAGTDAATPQVMLRLRARLFFLIQIDCGFHAGTAHWSPNAYVDAATTSGLGSARLQIAALHFQPMRSEESRRFFFATDRAATVSH